MHFVLAITLSRMDDFANACTAYDKAINADPDDPLFHLNYAITLFGLLCRGCRRQRLYPPPNNIRDGK